MRVQDSHSSLNPRMPVRDSVAFGPFVEGKAKHDARDIAGDMLSKVGLDPGLFHHERGRQEGCRIAMIRAVDLAQQHNRIRPSARRRLVAIQFVLDSPLERRVRSEPVSEIGLFRAILDGNKLVLAAENREESQPWSLIARRGDRS